MARWAGDEIMNNPTIKSHIYMDLPHPPCLIMMMISFARILGFSLTKDHVCTVKNHKAILGNKSPLLTHLGGCGRWGVVLDMTC